MATSAVFFCVMLPTEHTTQERQTKVEWERPRLQVQGFLNLKRSLLKSGNVETLESETP